MEEKVTDNNGRVREIAVQSPKVSVIVPVYKAEAYLKRCVDSLLAQTFEDFEILLIDDGSPDRSGAICDDYARQDRRVRVIHKENGGVSSARQCGLDNACGEYVIHADPDDWTEPEMLEEMYRKAKEEDADMVIALGIFIDEEKKRCSRKILQTLPDASPQEIIVSILSRKLFVGLWNKLIRRSCYVDNMIKFPIGCDFGEDAYVLCRILLGNPKCVVLPNAYYHYSQCSSSLTKSRYQRKFFENRIWWIKELEKLFSGNDKLLQALSKMKVFVKYDALCSGLYSQVEFDLLFPELKQTYPQFLPLSQRLLFFLACRGYLRASLVVRDIAHKGILLVRKGVF